MIATAWRIGWLNLSRDRTALVLTFVVPVLFFSIFAAVFGSIERAGLDSVGAVLVFERGGERTPADEALWRHLAADPRLRLEGADGRSDAVRRVRRGDADAAIVVPDGLAAALATAAPRASAPSQARPLLEILVDERANPVAAGVLEGAVRGALFRLWAQSLFPAGGHELSLPVEVAVADAVKGMSGAERSTSFFAAGIGVMFLLFAVSGRGSLWIEERESGILSRLLTSGVGLTRLLVGRWLYLTSLGFAQVTLMFVWGSIAFALDLWRPHRLAGFLLVTAVTAAAAAALGLLLSVACRTRAQLGGVAVVLVLAMSAVGGSLFPRFLMPEALQRVGLATFNAWALDGYQKVFWYDAGLAELWPQITVLAAAALVLLALSRTVAGRSLEGARG